MNLLVIRHGIAEDKDQFSKTGKSDDLRPLTAEGREKLARGVRGLREAAPQISLLASSPLVRAVQTAEIVGKEYRMTIGDTTNVLRPEAPLDDFVAWLGGHAGRSVVAVVGHEPHLSALVTWLISGNDDSRIDLKKGAACMLTFEGQPARGRGLLCWALTPKQMRKLGDGE